MLNLNKKNLKNITIDDAFKILDDGGFIEVDGETVFSGDAWRVAIIVIRKAWNNGEIVIATEGKYEDSN